MASPSNKHAILAQNAPRPIGPYSQAIKTGNLVFCSGQIALDPVTGEMAGPDVEAQTRRVMENVKAVLEAAGSGLDHVLKATIFLKSMSDFPKVNEIYGGFFTGVPPARSTIEVARLPKDALVEVEVIALAK